MCFFCGFVTAQLPLIDRGVQINGLWCFPLYNDTLTYVYLPHEASLAKNADRSPKFSYMRYVMTNEHAGTASSSSIQEGDGGAILNFLVLYNTPPELVADAESSLRKRMKNDSLKIRGPVVMDRGRYSLVSSLISGDSLIQKKQILSVGNAPVFENSSIALSFGLTPQTSKILTQNFKMSTPDISMMFDMEFSGLTEDYDAELEVNWNEVKRHQGFSAGGSVYFVSADVKVAFDELFKKQAVKLKVVGNNPNMEGLLNTVYDKLLSLLFEPVQPERLPVSDQNNMIAALAESVSGPNGVLSSRNTTGFGVNVGYQLKEMKTSGTSKLRFKGRSTVQRHHFITFNIGDLYKTYGKNTSVFRDAPLNDETFQQRSIMVGIDGDLEKEFEKMLNSVTVILSKQHLDGEKTVQNIIVTSHSVKDKNKIPLLVYGYRQDTTKWLEYSYRTIWQFRGGATYESGWKTQDASMVNLFIPYKRKVIELEGDIQLLQNRGVRSLSVQIEYPFFTQKKQDRVTINLSKMLDDKSFSITQPDDEEEVNYNITWITTQGERIQHNGKDKTGIIFIDELPTPNN
jgi:hypothetical protein